MSDEDCPFCGIVKGLEIAEVLARGSETMTITPLNPVTPGRDRIPRKHYRDVGRWRSTPAGRAPSCGRSLTRE
jgi:hypothetical protein